MTSNPAAMTDKQAALWMLERMKNSEEFLAVLRKARIEGSPDILDEPDYIAKHKARLKKLFDGDDDDPVEVPASVAAAMTALIERDLLSSPAELVEKAIGAYQERAREQGRGTIEAVSIFEAARREIEAGLVTSFREGFVAELADAGRLEQAQMERDNGRGADLGR